MNTLEISKNKLQEIRKAEEYFNALATNIQLSGVDLKVIAISSVQENEGKSIEVIIEYVNNLISRVNTKILNYYGFIAKYE